jgi:GH35 family endo-1,4-beta-xylanase
MKLILRKALLNVIISGMIIFSPMVTKAQYAAWYQSAQQRIDTLRKNDYGIKIYNNDGQLYTGAVSVRMDRHEFPFGVAFDFQQGEPSMGNTASISNGTEIQATADVEIYATERWARVLSYAIPVESEKEYKITLKFAETNHSADNARVFNALIDGEVFLENFDIHAVAEGRNIAVDTSITVVAITNILRIELQASVDNVAIKGIIVDKVNDENVLRINCGGSDLITSDGNEYVAELGFFAPDVETVSSNDDWRKATLLKYFNAGVNENSFKWSGVQPNPGPPNYTNFDRAVRWTQSVGWDYRAHTLLWGGDDNHSMPNWVRSLPTPQHIIDTCKMRVIRDVTRYRGIIKEYDVINETLTGHADWLRKTVGDSIIWDSFKWARSADPDAELYINDYNVELNWGQSIEYRDLILKMLENDAPITGIGVQAHFWDCCRPNVNEVVRNMNILAETGLPIKLTEYDFGGNLTQAQQAADYIMVLTIAFSHPSIVGMYHWSLRDGWAWRAGSGFFDSAGRPKLAADTLLYYTKTKWATNLDLMANGSEALTINAYHGDYKIEAEFDGVVKVFNVPFLKAHADSVFVLHEADAKMKGPQLLSAELIDLNGIRLSFDKPINNNLLRRRDFRVFITGNISINSAEVDPEDESSVILTLNRNVVPGRYLAVSYTPGSLVAIDGGVSAPWGPVPLNNNVLDPVNVSAVNSISMKVYPNPASGNVSISFDKAPYTIQIFNTNGIMVFSDTSNSELLNVDVSNFSRGMYIVQVTDAQRVIYIEKLILN